jgi:tripartite-type tricarboxylate transporter receptor subunit TctC
MFPLLILTILLCVGLIGVPERALGQDQFYQGKVLRIIVGFAPGGGYDTYTRLVGRHLGKHIPGNPSVVVENMAGANSLICANHIYRVAKPDGLTMANFIGGLFLQQLLAKPGIEFDARKFEYVGAPSHDDFVVGVSRATGITSLEQWLASKTVVKFGGASFGAGTDDFPVLLRAIIGLPIQMVTGYKGTSEMRLAFSSGEIGGISNSWQSTRSTWRNELESGELQLIFQAGLKSHPELTKYPVVGDYIKSDEDKKLLRALVQVHSASVRPYVVPPNTPKNRVQLLRSAFAETLKDNALLAEARKGNIEINAVSGEELTKSVQDVLQLESGLVARLKEILR